MRISDWSSDVCSSDLWRVGGRIVDPSRLDCPILNILSETDHIVPSVTACQAGKGLRLDSGHVGMIVGRRARTQLWNPLAEWLLESTRQCYAAPIAQMDVLENRFITEIVIPAAQPTKTEETGVGKECVSKCRT